MKPKTRNDCQHFAEENNYKQKPKNNGIKYGENLLFGQRQSINQCLIFRSVHTKVILDTKKKKKKKKYPQRQNCVSAFHLQRERRVQ